MKYLMPSFLKDFKCLEEGYCCHRWNISVTPKELDSILANLQKIPKENRPANCGFDIVRGDDNTISDVYTKSINNTCSFLVDKKCFLHMHFGMKGKPSICQSYPFYALKTPEITYINASMACPCSSLLLNNNNEFTLVNPTKFVGNEFSLKANLVEQKTVKLSENTRINWKSFYFIQKKLLRHHKQRGLIHKTIQILQKQTSEYLTTEQVQQIWREIENQENNNSHTTTTYLLEKVLLAWSVWHVCNQDDNEISPAILHFLAMLQIANIKNISQSAHEKYREIHQQFIQRKEIQNILDNYFFVLLFGSDFYFSYNVTDALCMMGFALELIIFFALASSGSYVDTTKEHLLDGVFAVEKFFFHSDYFTDLYNSKYKILGFSDIFIGSSG